MSAPSSDRNLLLGIVALQMDFISRDALVEAMNQWTLEKSRTLSEILVARGALDPDDQLILDRMVDRHIARHGGDARQSLSALDVQRPARSVFEPIDDPDIQQSLSSLNSSEVMRVLDAGPDATETWGETPPEEDGRFRVLRLHERGGLGVVFLARDTEVHRDVALKQMKEEIAGDPQLRARFVFEAEITGNLEHPGVVPVYGMGNDACGRPYYAMRFVRGDTFKSAVDHFHHDPALLTDGAARQREFQKLLRRFLAVCETMEYVHNRGIIHRDLKPRNILLGPYGETLVVDWGLAKVVGRRESEPPSDATLRPPSSSEIEPTVAGALLGTAAFMSPEQARGEVERQAAATDIYGLGATLYYLLTGRAPIDDPDRAELIRKVQRGEFRPPREVKSSVDRALDAVCRKAMSLEPADRYPSARALGEDLERWLADQAVGAYREPIQARVVRWVRRHRHLVASAAVLLFLSVLGLSWHAWRIGRENSKTHAALEQSSQLLGTTRTALREQFKLASTSLAAFGKTEELRLDLARNMVSTYKRLLGSYPTDPVISVEAAECYQVLGSLLRMTGKLEESLDCYSSSLNLFARLVAVPKLGHRARHGLVQDLIDRGELYRMNRSSQLAVKDYEAGLAQIGRLEDDPDRLTYCKLKASVLINYSSIMIAWDRQEEARERATGAIQLMQSASKQELTPAEADKVAWLSALAYANRAIAAHDSGDQVEAETSCKSAVEVGRKVRVGSDFFSGAQWVIAAALARCGEIVGKDPARVPEAEKCFAESLELARLVVAKHAEMPYFRELLAETLNRQSEFLLGRGLLSDAETACAAARQIFEGLVKSDSNNPVYLSLLGETLTTEARIRRKSGKDEFARELLTKAVQQFNSALKIDPERQMDRRLRERATALLK